MNYIKNIILSLILIQFSGINYSQIVADHTVVDKYDEIPQQYIEEVKEMLVFIGGESHATGYRIGIDLLEILDNKFQAHIYTTQPVPDYSDEYLRFGEPYHLGEQIYTSASYVNSLKNQIESQFNAGNPYAVVGFGWCYDMTWINDPGGTIDPVYNVHWAGSSVDGPDGNLRWGLDPEDEVLTGNSVCMDTYLMAVEDYNAYCETYSPGTKFIFTTGPVDDNAGTENGFQRELKHDYIRAFVAEDNSRILFDYADILCRNNNGEEYITEWNDDGTIRTHVNIHPDNLMDYDDSWNIISQTGDGDHIGEVGALRLAKAMWWMLARIAGWDGIVTATEMPETSTIEESVVSVDMNSDKITVNVSDQYLNGQVSLYNSSGQLIDSRKILKHVIYLSTSLLSSGLYLVVLSGNNRREVKKIIIQQ